MRVPTIISALLLSFAFVPAGAQVDMDLNPVETIPPPKEDWTSYVGLAGMWVDNNTDSTIGGALRLGWHFFGVAPYFISTDVEVEASYWDVDSAVSYGPAAGKAKTKNLPLMVNLRVNVPLSDTGFFLYGGGGGGFTYIDIKGTSVLGQSVKDTGAVFTYAFFVGVGIEISDRASLRAGYRSIWLTDDTFNDGSVKVTLSTEQNDIFELALRLNF